jgi:DNA-binding winged helix-turn-helix (wHTH) protein
MAWYHHQIVRDHQQWQMQSSRYDSCDSKIFEVDLRTGELRKAGAKLRFGGQPFQVLAILLERPGDIFTREELQKRQWPDTFVDVDHNLNTAINKIREVLGDSAESPRFVETMPRRGYRFIGELERPNQAVSRQIEIGRIEGFPFFLQRVFQQWHPGVELWQTSSFGVWGARPGGVHAACYAHRAHVPAGHLGQCLLYEVAGATQRCSIDDVGRPIAGSKRLGNRAPDSLRPCVWQAFLYY